MTAINDASVLITGAAGGFGRHMVVQFLQAGGRLILTDLQMEALENVRDEIVGVHADRVSLIPADLSTMEGCRELYDAVTAAGPVPDIVVNNAGLAFTGDFQHVPHDRWELLVQVNLLAPIRLTELFLPAMLERDSGHIVNVASAAGLVGAPSMSTYCASKFGLRGFGEAMAFELEGRAVQVSTVFPSYSRTGILDGDHFGDDDRGEIPDAYLSEPTDVVAATIDGIRRNKRHIYPDRGSRLIRVLLRLAPRLIPRLQKDMYSRMAASR
jgi:short-subunit dehydrogenase